MELWISLAAVLLSGIGIGYTHRQSSDSRATRVDTVRAQRSALIRVHRIRGEGGDHLVVSNLGQADCTDAEIKLLGVPPDAAAWIGVRSGQQSALDLAVPAGGWIAVPATFGMGIDIMSARIEVCWSDGEGRHSTVQTLGSSLGSARGGGADLWTWARATGI